MKLRHAAMSSLLIGCGHAAPAPTPVPPAAQPAAIADAGAPPVPHASAPWRFVPARAKVCFARDAASFCVSPNDTGGLTRPHVDTEPLDGSSWELAADGRVHAIPNKPVDPRKTESWSIERAKEQDKLRGATAKGLPAFTKLVQTVRDSCGLTSSGEVMCWPEPYQTGAFEEVAVAGRAIRVRPKDLHATDLFLQDWSNLCVLGDGGHVSCSPPTIETAGCFFLRGGLTRCGPRDQDHLYDPRTLLTRPLVPVPDIEGARLIAPYAALTKWEMDMTFAHGDFYAATMTMRDGGCALDADGVSCFERDSCPKPKPWRTQRVSGVPKDLASLALADTDGYALDRAGNLYTWPRTAADCNAPAPTAHLFLTDVHAVIATECPVANAAKDPPPLAAVSCAAMNDGTMRCWRESSEAPATLSFPP